MSDFNFAEFSADVQTVYRGRLPKKQGGKTGGKIRGKPLGPLDLAVEQRPRERLISRGPQALSNTELLAVMLNTGIKGKNVSELARDLLKLLDRKKGVPGVEEIEQISGMGSTKAGAIAAMLEFGRRRWGATGMQVRYPAEIYALVRHYADRKQEHFISLSFNGAHEVLATRVVTIGLVNKTIVHPREVFADIIQDRASAFAVAHNHPSKLLGPSDEDDEITSRLKKSSEILGLHFVDHIIFSDSGWWSYRQNGKI